MTAADSPEWRLFADWCESLGVAPMPASHGMVVEYLRELPCARSVQVKRIRAIQAVHAEVGQELSVPRVTGSLPDMWRPVEGLVGPREAIAQTLRYRWPHGLVGRRDAWLILLTGILGLTRERARTIGQGTGDVLVLPGVFRIAGKSVTQDGDPRSCPACTAARWLDTIGPHFARGRGTYLERLNPTSAQPDRHDCERTIDNAWEDGILLPSIDRYGAVGSQPLSTRAISSIVAARRVQADVHEQTGYVRPQPGRFAGHTSAELAAEQDDVYARVDAANRELEGLLAEMDAMSARLQGFGTIPD